MPKSAANLTFIDGNLRRARLDRHQGRFRGAR